MVENLIYPIQLLQKSLNEISQQEFQARKAMMHLDIQKKLPPGFKIKPMPVDGSCLFHSLSEGLYTFNAVPISQDVIRAKCVQAIHSVEHLRNSFACEDAFVNELTSDGVYGDELSIRAFCHEYSSCVHGHANYTLRN